MAAASYDFDRSVENIFDRSRLAGAKFVDQVHVDGLVRMPEVQIFAPGFRNRQPGCRHMGIAGYKLGHNFGNAVDRFYNQRHAEIFGKGLYKIVLRARWAVGPHRERGRAISRDDPKLADFENLLEDGGRRRTGTEQPSERDYN